MTPFCCFDCKYLLAQLPKAYHCRYKKINIDIFAIEHRYFCFDCEIAIFNTQKDLK